MNNTKASRTTRQKIANHFRNGNVKIVSLGLLSIAFIIAGNHTATAMITENQAKKEVRAAAAEVQTMAYGFYFDNENPQRPTTPQIAERLYAVQNPDSNVSVKVEEKDNCFIVSAEHTSGTTHTMEEVCSD